MKNKNHRRPGRKPARIAAIMLAACMTLALGVTHAHAKTGPRFIRDVDIKMFHSFYYQSDMPIKRVSVAEPDIAVVKIISPYDLMVDGKLPASTMVTVWFEDGTYGALNVRVDWYETPPYWGYKRVQVIKGVAGCCGTYVPYHRHDYTETDNSDTERFVSE